MARKQTPTPLRILRGNPSKRPIPENEPTFEGTPEVVPEPPTELTDDQKIFWNDLCPRLVKAGVYSSGDRESLSLLCVALAEVKHANEQLKLGRVLKTPSGYIQQSPFVSILWSAMKRAQSLMTEFAMTPASRSRVEKIAGAGEEDPLQRFLNRGQKKKA